MELNAASHIRLTATSKIHIHINIKVDTTNTTYMKLEDLVLDAPLVLGSYSLILLAKEMSPNLPRLAPWAFAFSAGLVASLKACL